VTIRIVYVSQGYPPERVGGVEVYLRGLVNAIKDEHEVFIFTRASLEGHQHLEFKEELESGVLILRLRVDLRAVEKFSDTYLRPEVDEIFRNYLEDKKPDLVHIHHLGGLSLGMIQVAREQGLPVLMTLHDHQPFCPRGQRIRDDKRVCKRINLDECLECLKPQCVGLHLPGKAAMYLLAKDRGKRHLKEMHEAIHEHLELVEKIISPSRSHKERIAENGIDVKKIEVMPCGLDLSLMEKVTPREPGSSVRKFGYLGTLTPSKGVEDTIRAFKRMKVKGCSLHIYGEAVPYHGLLDYDKRLEEMGRGADISFHGPYQPEQLPQVFSGLDAVIMPSRWYESYGITIREAFRAGRPVIASDIGAFSEAIEHMENGIKYPPGDIFTLRDMMNKLASDPGLADRLAGTGGPVESLPAHREKLLRLYKAVLGRPE
jgi:glycosyltransferase involved in cell wall biosynthesis